ncbi:MAG: hypothetical protein HC884_05975 [Chloroflexaceae bacterium]|nr:hypothetical protein [Chloroflexaceae bacterium]
MTLERTRMLRIVFRLRSPLCIARRPTAPGQPIETLTYLTGTVVRGGIATAWLQGQRFEELEEPRKATFRALFLNPDLVFGNGLPLPSDQAQAQVEVVPQTAWAHKYDSIGWLYDEREGKTGEGVFDQLRPLLRHDPNMGKVGDTNLDRLNQMFAYLDRGHYQGVKVKTRLMTRTAIDPQRGTARERFLYTLEVLETGQRFGSTIRGPAQRLKELQAFALQRGDTLTMGQGRTRGLGAVEIERIEECEVPDPQQEQTQAVADVEHFTALVRQEASGPLLDEDGTPLDEDLRLLPVVLESDMLLRDDYLLPSSDPQPTTTLGRYRALSPALAEHMRLHRPGLVQSSHWIGGWDELRRLPRPPQLAVAMRSVWTFRVPSAHLQEAVAWWLEARQQGVGERCSEGYGRVRLGHPLHLREGEQ